MRQTGSLSRSAVVEGVNNPPQDVIWSVSGGEDVETHMSYMSQDGTLYCGDEELLNRRLYVTATAVYDPDKSATVRVLVVAEDDPRVEETTIDAVIVTPGMVEAAKGEKITFKATVLGQNNPP